MPDQSAILAAFREELVTANLVRKPSSAGALPPLHIEPRGGAPAPGEREGIEDDANLVLSLFASGELSEDNFDAVTRRRLVIDVRYRAASSAAERSAMALDAAIRGLLIRPDTNYGFGFELGSASLIFVHQAALFGGLGPIERGEGLPFTLGAKWMIECAP